MLPNLKLNTFFFILYKFRLTSESFQRRRKRKLNSDPILHFNNINRYYVSRNIILRMSATKKLFLHTFLCFILLLIQHPWASTHVDLQSLMHFDINADNSWGAMVVQWMSYSPAGSGVMWWSPHRGRDIFFNLPELQVAPA